MDIRGYRKAFKAVVSGRDDEQKRIRSAPNCAAVARQQRELALETEAQNNLPG